MPCPSCGTALSTDAAYCSRCGSRVELGSVLGVGTDLPPVPRRDTARADQRRDADRVRHADLGRTAELPRVVALPPSAPGPDSGRTRSHSRGSIAAMVATFVVLTVLGTFALTRLTGSPAPAVAVGASAGAGSGAPSSSDGATESDGPVPVDATRCSTSGDDAVATAYAGTERTSCEFAGAVRTAYRKAGTPGDATSLRAFSPVTKKWYSLSCDGAEPVRCTSTTGAVVVLTAA